MVKVAFVEQVDVKIPVQRDILEADKMSADAMVEILKDAFGDKMTVVIDGEESAASTSTSGNRGGATGRAGNSGRSSTPSSAQLQRSIMDQLRSRGGGGNRGGGNTRGRGR